MSTPKSTINKKQIRTAATNSKELFQATQASHDEVRLMEENVMQETFRAVILSSPIDENNVGTSKPGPNAIVTPQNFVIVSVKPISDQEFHKVSSGEVTTELSQIDTPVPGDSMPSAYDIRPDDTNKFLKWVHRYHKIDDLKASSVDPIGNTTSLRFGQIVNCYFRKGSPNNPLAPRDELVFEVPINEIIHPFYTSFLEQVETNSAKEPFKNNSNNAVSVLGALAQPSGVPLGTPTTSGPDAIGTGPNLRSKKVGGVGMSDSGFTGRKEGPNKNPSPTLLDKKLIDRIVKFESFGGNYTAWNRIWYIDDNNDGVYSKDSGDKGKHKIKNGKNGKYKGKLLTDLTFAEVKQSQSTYGTLRYPIADPGEGNFFAMGKYQFIPKTMLGVIEKMGFEDDEKFSKKNQDAMGYYLIYSGNKRKYLTDYLLGGGTSLWTALFDLSAEFSSIQASDGKGYYGSESNAANSAKQMSELLKKIRASNIANGRTGS